MILLYKEDQVLLMSSMSYCMLDNTINLNEFDVVDIDQCEDEYEILDIQNEPNSLLQVK